MLVDIVVYIYKKFYFVLCLEDRGVTPKLI